MRSRVYVTVGCPSVCLSKHMTYSSKFAAAALLLWARWADIDRLLHGRRSVAAAGSANLSAYVDSLVTFACRISRLYVRCVLSVIFI